MTNTFGRFPHGRAPYWGVPAGGSHEDAGWHVHTCAGCPQCAPPALLAQQNPPHRSAILFGTWRIGRRPDLRSLWGDGHATQSLGGLDHEQRVLLRRAPPHRCCRALVAQHEGMARPGAHLLPLRRELLIDPIWRLDRRGQRVVSGLLVVSRRPRFDFPSIERGSKMLGAQLAAHRAVSDLRSESSKCRGS